MDFGRSDAVVAAVGPGSRSLESRLGVLRRRRRHALLTSFVVAIGPVLLGLSILLLLAASGAFANLR